jgi:AraC-like DNA-binding protein
MLERIASVTGRGREEVTLPAPEPAEGGVHRRVFEGELVYVGLFHCRPWHPLFHDDRITTGDLVVFPRSSVYITHEGHEPLVADPNVVVFYNRGQAYERGKLSAAGDFSEYFGFQPQILWNVLQRYDPGSRDRPENPFRFTHAPSDAHSYLLQRTVVQHVLSGGPPDPVFVEEAALNLLERVLARTLPLRRSPAKTAATRRAHRDLAHDARSLLATSFAEPLTLQEIADRLYSSPYHLSRVFRQQTGETIHQYRNQLRLRAGLAYLLDTDLDLSTLALRLGYSHHSHFSHAFRQAFAVTPTGIREARAFPELSKILTA